MRRGTLIVLAGPSGVGKGSVVERLRSRDPEGLAVSISATTRRKRPGETGGVDYLFVDDAGFDRMVAAGDLLEWAEVYPGRRYGTPRSFVDRTLAEGRDVVLEIDVQGAAQIRSQAPEAVLILLAPPSMDALEARLRGRGTEDEASVAERLAAAARELEQAGWFDHVVVNDDVDRAADEVAAIIEAFRTR
ncbi:MAG TPA: guanylate kinase [Actinomycetota bacterium]|nr:guanylate kinase [Actinomycetota bacterium]